MPVLTLDYRHCDRKRPKYVRPQPECAEWLTRPGVSRRPQPSYGVVPLAPKVSREVSALREKFSERN